MTDIGKEYGTAFFMLASEENKRAEYAEALETVKAAFLENPQFLDMLSSPSISLNERLDSIDAVFSTALPEHLVSYLKLLCEKGRILCFIDSVEEYKALLDASERVSSARITSAVELTEDEKQRLISKLEAIEQGKVRAEYFVDPALLGGVIVELDGRIMDGSLRHRLYDIKDVMNR